MYAKIIDNKLILYVKPDDVLCEDPTKRGYKEVIYSVGNGGMREDDTTICVEVDLLEE